ncbi:MAG: helix-turn-helix transcriptional regulator, partial [Clostridia bacterium]|nr:helix-turn-helix transcriptional regulator [Clostridia bacterium]
MTFKEKLVILRKGKNLTQDDFASAVGVSRQAVYKWECGQSYPEVPKLLEMKLLFGISLDNLLDDSYDIPIPEKKKKRISKSTKARIEASVESTASETHSHTMNEVVKVAVEAPAAPKAAPAAPKAAPAPAAAP